VSNGLKVKRSILYESFKTWKQNSDFKDIDIKPKDFNKEISKLFGSENPANNKISMNGDRIYGWYFVALI
jgi:hypothetical protein